jgi:hypothetical protein
MKKIVLTFLATQLSGSDIVLLTNEFKNMDVNGDGRL